MMVEYTLKKFLQNSAECKIYCHFWRGKGVLKSIEPQPTPYRLPSWSWLMQKTAFLMKFAALLFSHFIISTNLSTPVLNLSILTSSPKSNPLYTKIFTPLCKHFRFLADESGSLSFGWFSFREVDCLIPHTGPCPHWLVWFSNTPG